MTMVMPRTKITQTVISAVKNAYGRNIKIFDTQIPFSIRAVEATAEGKHFRLRQKRKGCRSL